MITAVSSFKSDSISPNTNCSRPNTTQICNNDSFQKQKAGQPSFKAYELPKAIVLALVLALLAFA